MRGTTHPSEHAPILAAALIACLAVLGGIVPGVPVPQPFAPAEILPVARPGIAALGLLEIIESGYPACRVVSAQLIGGGGAELNSVRTAFPRSRVVVSSQSGAGRRSAQDVLVCPR